uniref:Secreted protein n=1 Tax=Anguilla anguilla TaxID=7936 RepID=A0A0E9VT14_ANGAN
MALWMLWIFVLPAAFPSDFLPGAKIFHVSTRRQSRAELQHEALRETEVQVEGAGRPAASWTHPRPTRHQRSRNSSFTM